MINSDFKLYKQFLLTIFCISSIIANGQEKKYEPNWESLDSRPVPQWFSDAKFGIFIHWGPYSVPAWTPKGVYSEWYQDWLVTRNLSGNGNPSPTAVYDYHRHKFGEHFSYYNFGEMFKAEDFNPADWAKLFKDAGAKYIVLTSKHHDGFALWPSKEADKTWGFPWNSVSNGPHRDLVGDLEKEVRKTDVKFGLYYSLYEWYNPLWLKDTDKYVDQHFLPQIKDLVNTYQPDILWSDGDWEINADRWKAPELLAWIYNESPVKDKILVNDRWGKDVRRTHGTFLTSEYGGSGNINRAWEETRGIGISFGYNRNEDLEDYNSPQTLILLLADVVSHGGNLLLDIGPDGNGKIPVIMQERLLQMGEWLKVNGEAVYGTRQWKNPVQWSKGNIVEALEYKKIHKIRYLGGDFILKQTVNPEPGMAVKEVFFTKKGSDVYAILPKYPDYQLIIKDIPVTSATKVTMLGTDKKLEWKKSGDGIVVMPPALTYSEVPCRYAWVLKITGVQ